MFLQNTVHPLPDIIVRMRHWRNLRNRVMTSAQVYLARNVCVPDCGPSQVWFGIHLPIVVEASAFCKTFCDGVLSCRMARATDACPVWGGGLNISWHPTAVPATIVSLVAGQGRTAMYRDRDAEASF
jgi:hypothetical protein